MSTITQAAQEYYNLKKNIATINKELERRKNELKTLITQEGQKDDRGSFVVDFDGKVGGIRTAKNQLNVSTHMDEQEAESILRQKGLWEAAIDTVEVLNVDKLHALFYEKKISRPEFKRIFKQKSWYSLYLIDEDGNRLG